MRIHLICLVAMTLTWALPSRAMAQDFSHFGAGFAFLTNVTGADWVEEAHIDDLGFVRVDKRVNTSIGVVFEAHQLFTIRNYRRVGIGPFIAIRATGENKIIDAAGAGIMFGFKPSATNDSALSIGIGYAGLVSVQSLGEEFEAGAAAPARVVNTPASGTTPATTTRTPLPLRYEKHDAGSLMIVTSFMF